MRFAPRLSVGARLTLAMILVVVLSWLLGGMLVFQLNELGLLRPGPPRRPPPAVSSAPDAAPVVPPPAPETSASRRDTHDRAPFPPSSGMPPRPGPLPLWRNPILVVHLAVGVLVAVVAGLWLSRRFTRPLATLAEGAQVLERGRLEHRIALAGDDEFVRVATSMNHMAKRIAEQIRELEEDSRRRQHLLADVAHELRTPVASLKAMAEALRDGVASGAERSEHAAGAVAESAERLDRLVSDLLELARLDLQELPLHPQPVDLRAAVADCLRRHRDAADSAGIRIRPSDDGQPVSVSGDPHRLTQILDNLMDNAISYAGRGAEVRVTVEPGDPVVVTVADTGRGIPAEHLPFLFDPFYRVDAARTPGDTHSGLGLRIARGLAEAHGGTLRVESAEGRGTRAILTLPSHGSLPRQDNHGR
jgi:signal transduction histidine kinase